MANKNHYEDVAEKIEVFILRAPLGKAKFWSSQASFPERNSLLVKITSSGYNDCGEKLTGWGEAGQYGPPEPVASAIEHVLGPRVVGQKILPTKINEDLYSFSRDFGQRGSYIEAISGIDVALWDLLGKTLRVPLCRLLGGEFRKKVKVYATGCYYRHDSTDPSSIDVSESAKAAAEEALSFKEAGFRAVKIKIGLLSVDDDLRRIKAIREAIGPKEEMSLMVDANHAYSVPVAKRMAKELEQYNIRWFEEPVIPEDISGYREIRSSTSVPISGGECSFTRYGFRDLLVANNSNSACLDIAQPDIAACGGISEFLKICVLASTFGVTVIPHVWGSAVGLAAGLHAVATLPPSPYTANPIYLENEPVIEFDRNPNPLRDELLKGHKFELDKTCGGSLDVPFNDVGGLGIEVDETVLEKYNVPLVHTGVVET